MWQRVIQFREAGSEPTNEDIALAKAWLPGQLFDLFLMQHPRDMVHSVNTARWLLARGYDNPDLVAAALLHDIGKGDQRRVDRVAYVVGQWLRLSDAAGSPASHIRMRRALARSRDHGRAGAHMLRAAGASDIVVTLALTHHAEAGDDAMLALLQQADAAN